MSRSTHRRRAKGRRSERSRLPLALRRHHTASPSFVALLTAPAGYRPSLRLDRLGRDGATLARADDRTEAAWGDPRHAFVTGRVPRRAAAASSPAEVP